MHGRALAPAPIELVEAQPDQGPKDQHAIPAPLRQPEELGVESLAHLGHLEVGQRRRRPREHVEHHRRVADLARERDRLVREPHWRVRIARRLVGRREPRHEPRRQRAIAEGQRRRGLEQRHQLGVDRARREVHPGVQRRPSEQLVIVQGLRDRGDLHAAALALGDTPGADVRAPELDQQLSTRAFAIGSQRERPQRELGRVVEGQHAHEMARRLHHRSHERRLVDALEGEHAMVRDLGRRTIEGGQDVPGALVQARALPGREARVERISDERVGEVPGVAEVDEETGGHGRLEQLQSDTELRDDPRVELAPEHRDPDQRGPRGLGQALEARVDGVANGRGRRRRERPARPEQPAVLLHEQRAPLGDPRDVLQLLAARRTPEDRLEQLGHLVPRQAPERQVRRLPCHAPQDARVPRGALELLGPEAAEHQHTAPAELRRGVLEQEQGREIGRVEIVEHQGEPTDTGEEARHGVEELQPRARALALRACGHLHQARHEARDEWQPRTRGREDPVAPPPPHDLGEDLLPRPERGCASRLGRPAPAHLHAVPLGRARVLEQKPRLADAGLARDEHDLALSAPEGREDGREERLLTLATDEALVVQGH